jgi:hypothetical protein
MNGLASTIGSPAAPIDNVTLNNSTLTLPVQNGIASAVVTTLNINGTTDTINISSLPGIASFPAQFPVISYAGMNGAYDFVLGALPALFVSVFLMLAARALGLDCGPMSGFDNAKLDEEFFAAGKECEGCDQEFFPVGHVKSNFLCNLGYGDSSGLYPRAPRLEFKEACTLL